MPIFVLALVLEIVVSTLLVSLPGQKAITTKVLGRSVLLAEDLTPPPDQTPSPDQTDQTSPTETQPITTPSETTPPPETPTPVPTETTPGTSDMTQPVSTETPTSPIGPQPTPEAPASPSSESTTFPTETPRVSTATSSLAGSPEAELETVETPENSASTSAKLSILKTDELINQTDKIDATFQEEVPKEEEQLTQITDPEVKAAALTTFSSDKVSDIDKFTHEQDFNSTVFASQRLSNLLDQLKGLSFQSVSGQSQIRQKLADVCQQTNTILRTTQEIVPEELEQDLEINRSQCLGY